MRPSLTFEIRHRQERDAHLQASGQRCAWADDDQLSTNAVNDARWRIMTPKSPFDGCRIDRVPDAGVEIVEADPANRTFPDRVNESLGICLKLGPEHDLRAEGIV